MADPTAVNGQVTDALTQANVIVLASAPGLGLATGFQVGAHAAGLAMQNAVANQRNVTTMSSSAATQAAAQVLTLAPSVSARATKEALTEHALVSELISLSAALRARQRKADVAAPATPSPSATPGVPPRAPGPAARPTLADTAVPANANAAVPTLNGEPRMSDHEVLDSVRRSVDRLNTLLEDLSKHLASGPPPEIWKQLCEALDTVRRAVRAVEDRGRPGMCPPLQPPPVVPVGATPGVWNQSVHIQSDSRPRIVGASYP